MERLADRVAVVTGAGSGIGRATASLLAERGCRLALVDVQPEGIAETARLIGGEHTTRHVADVSDEDRMAALPAEIVAAQGACHILVNNAGVATAGRFEDDDLDLVKWVVGINLWGVVHGCKFFLPELRKAEEAHIVNLSSMAAFVGVPMNAAYSMTKGGVRTFTEALRSELITSKVGVTSVHPGAIKTNIMRDTRGSEGARVAKLASTRLAGVVLTKPDTVAQRIVRGIEANRARVVIGPDARFMDLVSRVAPGRSGLVGRAVNRATGKR